MRAPVVVWWISLDGACTERGGRACVCKNWIWYMGFPMATGNLWPEPDGGHSMAKILWLPHYNKDPA